jgi:hypothetical protein
MKVAIYTSFRPIFNRLCESWRSVFIRHGIACETVTLEKGLHGALPLVADADVHLYIGGLSMLEILAAKYRRLHWPQRLFTTFLQEKSDTQRDRPSSVRHVLWLFEAMTDRTDSIFAIPTRCMMKCVHWFDLVLTMDHLSHEYLSRKFPSMPLAEMPFMIAEEYVRTPLPENERTCDILMLGRATRRRRHAEALFHQRGMDARFVYNGLYGDERYALWGASRISVNIHRDVPFYFDRVRTFEAWAAGTAVVSEKWGDLASFGVEEGKHLITAAYSDLPDVCASLLADVDHRQGLVRSAQTLLRNRYTPEKWSEKIIDLLCSL